jgi:hypothetical protein
MSDRVHGEGSCATLCGRDRGTRSSVTSLVRLDRFGGADQAARDARPRDEEPLIVEDLEPQAIAARGADPRVGVRGGGHGISLETQRRGVARLPLS